MNLNATETQRSKTSAVHRKRRRFSLEFKSKIILKFRELQTNEKKSEKSINCIARLTGIDRRTICN